MCLAAVTTAENGLRALEYLGLASNQRNTLEGTVSNITFPLQVFPMHASNSCIPNIVFYVYLQVSKVNLIITDYCMPGMTGYELLKKIKVLKNSKNEELVTFSKYPFFRINSHQLQSCLCFWKQESSVLKEVPVVIMSSENSPTRISQ